MTPSRLLLTRWFRERMLLVARLRSQQGGNGFKVQTRASNGTAMGSCIDVPDASQQVGVGLQISGCNDGRNQAIAENANGTLSPLSSPQVPTGPNAGKLSLCLAPSAGGSSGSSRLAQTLCNFSAVQYVCRLWSVIAR